MIRSRAGSVIDLAAGLFLFLFCIGGLAGELRGAPLSAADAQLQSVLDRVGQGRLDIALMEVDRVITRYPNFRLAHLVRGDLLLGRAKPIAAFGNTGHAATERLAELRAEALVRLHAHNEHLPADRVPRYLLQLNAAQKHAVVVDANRSRVYVYENMKGMPRLVRDYYTTLGKYGIEKQREGDKKTPLGVYHVTSTIPGDRLPDLYGWGALPINYPNEWDRRLGKTGYGIWIHGVPSNTYARAPWASDGCIALANPDLEELAKNVQAGITPVIIADSVEWVTPDARRVERDDFTRTLEAWRKDWETRDFAADALDESDDAPAGARFRPAKRFFAEIERHEIRERHDARDFRTDGMDLRAWGTHKRRVNAQKTWITVSLTNLSIFRSPGRKDLIAVTFDQDYRSDNLAQTSRKRQYWTSEYGRWKIAYEGPVQEHAMALPESFQQQQRRNRPFPARVHKAGYRSR